MKAWKLGLICAAFIASACGDDASGNNGDGANNGTANNGGQQRDTYIEFDVAGGPLDGHVDPVMVLEDGFWVWDEATTTTRFNFQGEPTGWEHVTITIETSPHGLGTFDTTFDDDKEIAENMRMFFQGLDGQDDYALIPRDYALELVSYDEETDTIEGTFSGEFWEHDSDFLPLTADPSERTQVEITNGKFKARWQPRNGENSVKWPQ